MRDIKFRAWNPGYYDSTGKLSARMTEVMSFRGLCRNGADGAFWPSRNQNGSGWTADFEGLIIMQYTGLKDKNGVEIFEGDVVQTTYNWTEEQDKGQIVVEHLTCGLRWLPPLTEPDDLGLNPLYVREEDIDGTGVLRWDFSKFEIIGNIWENQDLLKDAA